MVGVKATISVDLVADLKRLSRQRLGPKKDLLCRAVGLDKTKNLRILDGTMGFAKDSCHLLHFSAEVVATEQDSVVFNLVADALKRAKDSEFKEVFRHFTIIHCEISDFLKKSDHGSIDVLYLDPMFADVSKKSLPKKGMAFLRERQQLGAPSVSDCLDLAFANGIKRVVVKRPLKGEHLYGMPSYELSGNLVRYDIYLAGDN